MTSSRCISLLCLTCTLLFLSACGEGQRAETSPSDSAPANVQADVESTDGSTNTESAGSDDAVSGPGVMSITIWLGNALMTSDGQLSVMQSSDSIDGLALQKNDIIQSMNGTEVSSAQALKQQYGQTAAGDDVRLTVRRSGEEQSLTFTKPDSSATSS